MTVLRQLPGGDLSHLIRAKSLHLPEANPYDALAEAADSFADARIVLLGVLLGESTHGSS